MAENMNENRLTKLDQLIVQFDKNIVSILSGIARGNRTYPAGQIEEKKLSQEDSRKVEGYMRVNHAGEVSAQALYQGQALTARDEAVRKSMQESADEEQDHLDWCRQRLEELNGRTSYLDPVWYLGSFLIGTGAGLYGDKWSLGFIEETEKQVVQHLESHLDDLPIEDERTRAILEQMKVDEEHHGNKAAESGAAELPEPVKKFMGFSSKVMTRLAYWI